MEEIVRLTTIDNPYDPIDDYDRWLATDFQLAIANHRRDTCSMLALFARCSENFSDKRNNEEIERAIDEIEAEIQNSLDREVTSVRIGELVMDKLKDIDEVAYVRFASVYRQFKDINTFMSELKKLLMEE